MTRIGRPTGGPTGPTTSRRGFLTGGLALGVAATMPGCAYIRDDVPVAKPLPASAKAKIDGDLVYFNWADYLDPKVLKGFQKEYGVKIIESNFDSMEGMYAKIAAGNQYDIVFPIAKWVVKMRREGKLRAIDHDQLRNADQIYYSGSYFNDPWYDPKSRVSVPFTVYKTGIGWRTDKVSGMTGSWRDLWNPQGAGHIFTLDDQDEALGMAALLLGYDVNTAKASHLDDMKKLLISQKKVLRAYSSDDVNNMNGGGAWIHHMWSGDFMYLRQGLVDKPSNYDFEAPREGTPINSDAYAIPTNAKHPGTAMLFIDYLLRPENAIRNINYLYYPFPVKDAVATFTELAKEVPACDIDVKDLENPDVFRLLGTDEVQRRTAAWTEVKAS
jgi:spermidine/putrescine transport system substrate-binding protein